ncbi:RNA dependent RNA polymerase [Lachnoclostridium sp.]|uniref:RNA dependent RNA polymerase n=1 Tax=Lachnoclostridium sp. TaxID=2028282 RepID=UPI0028A236D1|nr:hypothetical protein [Lachnoclostridium sp.]
MESQQYTLIKLPIKEIILQNYNVFLTRDEELNKDYLITQPSSLLFDQVERLRGSYTSHINEIILIVAKKNPKQEKELRHILNNGFTYNNIHYSRFGKSASQGRDGITAFLCDELFKELYMITQMNIEISECVISKYEAQRCLPFSSCTLVPNYLPYIVIVGEYQKTLYDQLIKYVVEHEREYTDKDTGMRKKYNSREIEEGYKNITISPFDGCGCHEADFMNITSHALNLDYQAIGNQIRLPFIKGYSVYVPFKQILKEWGYTKITDVYGHTHNIDDIDCIWNLSMFKGHKYFKETYGKNAWIKYMETLHKYHYKLGISKYSHHTKNINKKTRMNFQYLQCLDLWNSKYIEHYQQRADKYDILLEENEGKIIKLARYTTDLYEKIIKGDTFYTLKFMGITDTNDYESDNKYMKAILINKDMLKDPAIKKYIYRKLKKAIDETKVGKIYVDGFYHTVVGDMIGYLQYAIGIEPVGCLNSGEFYCNTLNEGECISFRSPLVCPSEVNKINIINNEITSKWFSYFKDQDIVMLNMYDLSAPQQGGMDYDGDIVLLCNDPIIVNSIISKPIIIDIDDKATAISKPYSLENITDYEVMTRDNRIGEITNVATSISNKYTDNPEIRKQYSDYISLLRIYQGKEIDFLKTGYRWQMSKALRNHSTQLPWFLLYNYPKKLETYEKLKDKNKNIKNPEDKIKLNSYHSPSPMNELCEYVCDWEKKRLLSDNSIENTKPLIINHNLNLTDKKIVRIVRHYINNYAMDLKNHLNMNQEKKLNDYNHDALINQYKKTLLDELSLNEELIANYVISVSYNNPSISKSLAWSAFGDYIIKNLYANTHEEYELSIVEIPSELDNSYEYLGKYYNFKECEENI